MNENNNYFEEFIGISSLQKTLRNALIPTDITKENIERSGIIKADELRNENRQKLKDVMDDYYRAFLTEKLLKINDIDWSPLFNEMEKQLKNGDNNAKLEKERIEKRKVIYKHFSEDERFKKMFSAKLLSDLLPDFIIKNNNYSADEKNEKLELVSLFDKFATSFKEFFNNRNNAFSKEDIASSVCHRIVNDNAEIYLNNIFSYKRIVNKLEENEIVALGNSIDVLKDKTLEQIYSYEGYSLFLTQDGITLYNDICGKVNSYMNLYCQENKENKNEYKMRKLHKQILCISESSYEIPYKFQSDEEVYDAVNGFIEHIIECNIPERLSKIADNIGVYDLSKIYVNNSNFELLSQKLYGDWAVINNGLEMYYTTTLTGSGKSKTDKVKKAIKNTKQLNLAKINEMVAEYRLYPNSEKKSQDYISYICKIIDGNKFETLTYDSKVSIIENEKKASEIKDTLDVIMNIYHWCKTFISDDILNKDIAFYSELEEIYDEISYVYTLYNLVRNYVTQKPYSTEKIKLNFGSPTLADGWSKSKEYSNNAIILMKDELLYLGIYNVKNKPDKKLMEGKSVAEDGDYKKMIYNLLPGPNKMLPKVFISSKTGVETYNPSDYIMNGYKQNKHIKSSENFDVKYCRDLIDYYKACINMHPEWKKFDFKFSDTSEYEDISGFYREVENQGYKINWTYISENSINKMQEDGQLFLFQIYNKDFSKKSTGTPNLHTMYLKNLFSNENLKDIVLKLNGEAEIFFRKSSIKEPVVHKKGTILVNKTYKIVEDGKTIRKIIPDAIYTEIYNNLNQKNTKPLSKEATKLLDMGVVESHEASKDIVKDYRYTYDKYFLHLPITINFKAESTNSLNDRMLQYIVSQNNMHIIGIDRGERNLIYVSVIDAKGNIVDQKSFNIVDGYDYQDKLKKQENSRQNSRREWKNIGKIKEIKEGYLSLVIHEIAKMVVRYNAIVVMEDLNYGFKTGRFKVERQVYQKFETMLINKLNYLVFKNRPITENGGLLKGYQLTFIPDSKKKNIHQCGCIFYIPAAYTSKIDPTTGFVNIFKFKNLTLEGKRNFINNFDSIKYDSDKEMFVFSFDYNNFVTQNVTMSKTNWQVYTNGGRVKRKFANGKYTSESDIIDINSEMKKTFERTDITWQDGRDLREDIINYDLAPQIVDIFRLTVQLRNSLSESENKDYDKIVSPVINSDGYFFDSSNSDDSLPKDADANGAYCIALKGLLEVKKIKENWHDDKFSGNNLKITHNEWFDFIQNKRYL